MSAETLETLVPGWFKHPDGVGQTMGYNLVNPLSIYSMSEKTVVIQSELTDSASVSKLQSAVEKHGFHLETCIPELGTLVGTIDDARLISLAKLQGVHSVTEEDTVQISPPGSAGPY